MTKSLSWHTEKTIGDALRKGIAGSTVCRVAVAYCGQAAHEFFPEDAADLSADLRILVDASSAVVQRGLTNPTGLKRLLGLTPQLRSLACLHAKVFIFDAREALVGSLNLSAGSLEGQYQVLLRTRDVAVVRQLIDWFDNFWASAEVLHVERIRQLQKMWPPGGGAYPRRPPVGGRLKKWRGQPPEPPLSASDFSVGVTKREIKRLLGEFKTRECKYVPEGGMTCWEVARSNESEHADLSKELRKLMRRRNQWKKNDLRRMFEIAHTNGRAARIMLPVFARQRPSRVANTLSFLLEGQGDPFVRYEKVLSKDGRYKLPGLGPSGLAFLMYLWAPKEVAISNASTEKGIRALKVSFERPVSGRKGQGLKDRTEATRFIARLTGLKTLTRVDHFLDSIGKKHISRPRV
jgi:hypothetical protein